MNMVPSPPSLAEVTVDLARPVSRLASHHTQERFVATMAGSLAGTRPVPRRGRCRVAGSAGHQGCGRALDAGRRGR